MYEKVATVTVSIEETVSIGQGRGVQTGTPIFPTPWASCPRHARCPRTTTKAVSLKFILVHKSSLVYRLKSRFLSGAAAEFQLKSILEIDL